MAYELYENFHHMKIPTIRYWLETPTKGQPPEEDKSSAPKVSFIFRGSTVIYICIYIYICVCISVSSMLQYNVIL